MADTVCDPSGIPETTRTFRDIAGNVKQNEQN